MRNTHSIQAVVAVATLTLASVAPAKADAQVKKIDLRNRTEPNTYFVCFTAKAGGVGHAFVVFGTEDRARGMSVEEAWGQYPDNGLKAGPGTVPGGIVNEALKGNSASGHDRLIAVVNTDQWVKVKAVLARWMRQDSYRLVEQDCVTFTDEVAASLGLRRPARGGALLPVHYIRKLIEAN